MGYGLHQAITHPAARTLMILRGESMMHGRVIALYNIIFLGSTPIGGVIVGWAGQEWGRAQRSRVAGLTAVTAAWSWSPQNPAVKNYLVSAIHRAV